MRPPDWFVKNLAIFDSLLRVRWGAVMKQWVIDRESSIPETELQYLINREHRLHDLISGNPEVYGRHIPLYWNVAEEAASARQGRRVVLTTPVLNEDIFRTLMLSDISRYGGYSRYADELEASEAKAAAEKERAAANLREDINRETADMLHYIWRKRENALLNGHRNMNYLLHGKESDKPVITLE